MPATRTFLTLLLSTSISFAADAAKLKTLAGAVIEGELVSVSDKEIVFRVKDKSVSTPLADALDLDLAAGQSPSLDVKYTDVELTDGSLLHCSQFSLKGKQVLVKLVQGQELKLPLSAVSYVLNDANEPPVRKEWLALRKGNRDILGVRDGGKISSLEGTFGDGDEKGETIEFELSSGKKARPSLSRAAALGFFRRSDPNGLIAQPQALCKVFDTYRNVLIAQKVVFTDAGFTITTVAGVKIDYPKQMLARLDFSKGKLTYLSDLDPVKVIERSSTERVDHYRRDKNLDEGPIRLAGTPYSKGLALHAYTELVYDIEGQYKEFKALLGVDDVVGGDSHVRITIEGDGKELFVGEIKRKDKPVPLTLDVKNIKQLRIVAKSLGFLDLGNHATLAEAKVTK